MNWLFSTTLILVVGCSSFPYDASRNSDLSTTRASLRDIRAINIIECTTPSKTYGDNVLDRFLDDSYYICEVLRESQQIMTEALSLIHI